MSLFADYYNHVNQLVKHYLDIFPPVRPPIPVSRLFDTKISKPEWEYAPGVLLPLSIYQDFFLLGDRDNDEKLQMLVRAQWFAFIHQWSKTKQILVFKPDLTRQLEDSDLSENVPSSLIVERFPYPCFYVGTPGLLEHHEINGFFVHLTREREDPYYSLRIGLDFVECPLISVPFPLLPTVSESLDEVERHYNKPLNKETLIKYKETLVKFRENELKRTIRDLAGLALKHLYYLLSENSDREIPQSKSTGKPRHNSIPKNPTIQKVGFNLAPYFRGDRESSESESNGSGLAKAPHIRRGHLHTFKVGKGRKQTVIKWIAPIAVNQAVEGDLPTSIKSV